MRPAIAVPIPARRGPSVLIDAGANADARPEHLAPVRDHGRGLRRGDPRRRRTPRCACSRSARSAEKGNQLTLEAHALLAASDLNFAGNCEGRDVLAGAADVVVTDGFTGNVALKLLEGTITNLLDALARGDRRDDRAARWAALLIRPAARRLRKRLDPDTYGGAYLLGLRGLAVIAHGNSSRTAIANAIGLAARGVEHDVVGRLASPACTGR